MLFIYWIFFFCLLFKFLCFWLYISSQSVSSPLGNLNSYNLHASNFQFCISTLDFSAKCLIHTTYSLLDIYTKISHWKLYFLHSWLKFCLLCLILVKGTQSEARNVSIKSTFTFWSCLLHPFLYMLPRRISLIKVKYKSDHVVFLFKIS